MATQLFMLNLGGSFLLVVGLILHIVCLASPNMAFYEPAVKTDGDVEQKILGAGGLKASDPDDERALKDIIEQVLSVSVEYGLWDTCFSRVAHSPQSQCISRSDSPDWMRVVQALSVMATMLAFASLVLSALGLVFLGKARWKRSYSFMGCAAAFLAGFLISVEVIVVAAKYKTLFTLLELSQENLREFGLGKGAYLDWCFGVEVVVALLWVAACIAFFIAARKGHRGEGVV